MPIPTVLIGMNGAITAQNRAGALVPTSGPPYRYGDGPLAHLERPETVNLIRNPRFAGMAGWAHSDPTGALFPDPAITDDGQAAVRVTVASLSSTRYIFYESSIGTVAPGESYSASARARCSQPGRRATLQISWYTSAGVVIGASVVGTQTILATDGFTTISPLTAVAPDTASYARLLIRVETTNLQIGDMVWFSRPQLERGAVATPFTHGAMGPGYSWDGTPDASASRYTRQSKALLTEDNSTNLITNPSAETNLNFIGSATGAGSTITRETTHGYAGSCCVKVVTDGATAAQGVYWQYNTNTTGTARPFTGSLHLKGAGTVDVWTRINYTDATSTESAKVRVTAGSSWQRVIIPSVTADAAKTISNVLIFVRTVTAQIVTFWVDAAQLEERTYATSYVDGSLGTGYTWSGTAHASTSQRLGTYITVPNTHVSPVQGAWALRFMIPAWARGGSTHWLMYAGSFAVDDFLGIGANYGHNGGLDARLNVYARTANVSAIVGGTAITPNITRDVWHDLVLNYTASLVEVWYDGALVYTSARTAPVGAWNAAFQGWGLGLNSTTQNYNGYRSDAMAFEQPLAPAEIADLYQVTRPWAWEDLYDRIGGVLRVSGGEPRSVVRGVVTDPIGVVRAPGADALAGGL